jgi:MFS family permease
MSAVAPPAQVDDSGLPKSQFDKMSLPLLGAIVAAGIFASTLPQPQVLGRIPITNLLKNDLHLPRATTAGFFFLIGFFWYIKPLLGILTDAFPLFGTRRRHYLLFSTVLAAASWLLLGYLPKTYASLLGGCMVLSLFMVMMSTVTGAFLVEVGQSRGATGRLTSIRQLTNQFCQLMNGWVGGTLAMGSFAIVAGVNAVGVLILLPVAYFFLKEKQVTMGNQGEFAVAGRQVGIMVRNGTFWAAIIFIGLYYFAPGFSTLLFYRQQDVMHLNTQQQGLLTSTGAAGGILGAGIYFGVVRRFAMRTSLFIGVATSGLGTLLYLFYSSYGPAFAIDFQNGFFGAFAEVALIDLAARATPVGCEGLGYSCILSMRNISLFGADWLGSLLADKRHWSWETMVWLNAITTLVVLVLLPFMPKKIMGSRDTQGSSSTKEANASA